MDQSYDDVKRSSFNEASLKMTRIHKLQDIINICSVNKLGFFFAEGQVGFVATGQRNYEVIFQSVNQLYQEARPKCDSKERKTTENMRDVLNEFLKRYSPFTPTLKINGEIEYILNQGNWIVVEQKLTEYEAQVRELLDKHELSGRNVDDDEGL